jgi:hypothetical protein
MPNRHTCILDDGGTPNRRCDLCEEERRQAVAQKTTDSGWLVVRWLENRWEVYSFDDESSARRFHERAQTQWSDCYLARIVKQGAQADARPAIACHTDACKVWTWAHEGRQGHYCDCGYVPPPEG